MNPLKYLLAALGGALSAAALVLVEAAENCPEMITGGARGEFAAGPEAAPAGNVTLQQIADAELDKSGLPWDERIHVSTKTQTQKGVWTNRRGLDEKVLNKVVKELRQKYPEPSEAEPEAPAPVVTPPVVNAGPAVTIPKPVAVTEYGKLVDMLAKNTGPDKGVLTTEWANSVFASSGTTLAALATDEASSKLFREAIEAAIKGAGVALIA